MYVLGVKRDFIAQHYLVGGDWGAENEKHSHHYQVEVQLEGNSLDQHGYLADIVNIETALQALVNRYRERTLNELPEFTGLNPSLEHFERLFCQAFSAHLQAPNIHAITIKLWENDIAWASYRQEK